MDPKDIVKLQQHIKIAEAALQALKAACQADNDAKIREAMKTYRAAEQKILAYAH